MSQQKDCFKLVNIYKNGQMNKNNLRGAFSGPCTYENMVKVFQEKMTSEGNDSNNLIVQAFKVYNNKGKTDSKLFKHALDPEMPKG